MGLLSCAAALLQIHTRDTPPIINLLSWPSFKHSSIQNSYYKESYALVVFKQPSSPSPLRQEEISRISRRGRMRTVAVASSPHCTTTALWEHFRVWKSLDSKMFPLCTAITSANASAAAQAVDKLGSICSLLLHHPLPISVAFYLTARQVEVNCQIYETWSTST